MKIIYKIISYKYFKLHLKQFGHKNLFLFLSILQRINKISVLHKMAEILRIFLIRIRLGRNIEQDTYIYEWEQSLEKEDVITTHTSVTFTTNLYGLISYLICLPHNLDVFDLKCCIIIRICYLSKKF